MRLYLKDHQRRGRPGEHRFFLIPRHRTYPTRAMQLAQDLIRARQGDPPRGGYLHAYAMAMAPLATEPRCRSSSLTRAGP